MGLEVGGYREKHEWPKLGPSLLIATCLIVAIRTARWAVHQNSASEATELEHEIEFAAHVSGRVFALLVRKWPTIFPHAREPWYKPDGQDHPD